VQWSVQQQPGQQCQQEPTAKATHSHIESADASSTSGTQSSVAKPLSSPAATTTTTLVQTWRIF
jgi:hypothetical protein